MFGILNINKPAGWTSRDVVNRVQRLVRPAKVGHAGTLDPLATGVLVVCIGPATRLISYVQQQPKEYVGRFLLGRTSPSEDIETEMTEISDAPVVSQSDLDKQLPGFLGEIQQRPPQFSAVKVAGQRAYKLARSGETLDLAPRAIHIHNLSISHFQYPEFELRIRCGSGTYVRSLGRDLAESVGSGAVMSALTRTAIGSFVVSEALSLEELSIETLQNSLHPPLTAVAHLPRLVLSTQEIREILHGRMISSPAEMPPAGETLAAVDGTDTLMALLQEKRPGLLGPISNFASPE